MPEQKDLELLIDGHTPILQIETHEEKRALDLLVRVATRTSSRCSSGRSPRV